MVADQLQEEKIWRGKLGRSSAAGSSSAPIANKRMPLKPPNPAQSTATGIDATSRKIFEHLPLVIGGGGGGGGGWGRRTLRVGCGSVLLPSPPKYKGRIEMKKADWDMKVQIYACMAKLAYVKQKSRNVRVPITREMLRPKLEFLSLCVCVCEVLNDVDDPVNRSSCLEERVLSLAVVEVARKKGQRWRVKRAHSEIG